MKKNEFRKLCKGIQKMQIEVERLERITEMKFRLYKERYDREHGDRGFDDSRDFIPPYEEVSDPDPD